MKPLTKKQREVLECVRNGLERNETPDKTAGYKATYIGKGSDNTLAVVKVAGCLGK